MKVECSECKTVYNLNTIPSKRITARCKKCGQKFVVEPPKAEGSGTVTETEDQLRHTGSADKICTNCGTNLRQDQRFCGQCGVEVEANNACPKCQAPAEPENSFCGQCGTALNPAITSRRQSSTVNELKDNVSRLIERPGTRVGLQTDSPTGKASEIALVIGSCLLAFMILGAASNIFGLFLGWVIFGITASWLAKRRNRDKTSWFFGGFLLGPIGVLLILLKDSLPDPRLAGQVREEQRLKEFGLPLSEPNAETKICPSCNETIKLEALTCTSCQHVFTKEEVENQMEEAHENLRKWELVKKGKLCPQCQSTEVSIAMCEDDGYGPYCQHCRQSLRSMQVA